MGSVVIQMYTGLRQHRGVLMGLWEISQDSGNSSNLVLHPITQIVNDWKGSFMSPLPNSEKRSYHQIFPMLNADFFLDSVISLHFHSAADLQTGIYCHSYLSGHLGPLSPPMFASLLFVTQVIHCLMDHWPIATIICICWVLTKYWAVFYTHRNECLIRSPRALYGRDHSHFIL